MSASQFPAAPTIVLPLPKMPLGYTPIKFQSGSTILVDALVPLSHRHCYDHDQMTYRIQEALLFRNTPQNLILLLLKTQPTTSQTTPQDVRVRLAGFALETAHLSVLDGKRHFPTPPPLLKTMHLVAKYVVPASFQRPWDSRTLVPSLS